MIPFLLEFPVTLFSSMLPLSSKCLLYTISCDAQLFSLFFCIHLYQSIAELSSAPITNIRYIRLQSISTILCSL